MYSPFTNGGLDKNVRLCKDPKCSHYFQGMYQLRSFWSFLCFDLFWFLRTSLARAFSALLCFRWASMDDGLFPFLCCLLCPRTCRGAEETYVGEEAIVRETWIRARHLFSLTTYKDPFSFCQGCSRCFFSPATTFCAPAPDPAPSSMCEAISLLVDSSAKMSILPGASSTSCMCSLIGTGADGWHQLGLKAENEYAPDNLFLLTKYVSAGLGLRLRDHDLKSLRLRISNVLGIFV
jgi:hypothetical protein